MGRPLNKRYFGNRNIGTGGNQTTQHGIGNDAYNADDGIGGSGISGVTFSAAVLNTSYGTGKYLDRKPTMTLPAPTIANGEQAVGSVTNVQAVAALPNNKGTGYQIGDIVVGTTGTGTKARFRVTKLRVLDVVISNQAASQNFDGGENLVWDSLVDDNWTSPTILRDVTSTGSPNYDLGSDGHPYNGLATYGVWDGYVGGVQALAPTSLTITGGGNGFNTRGANTTNGTGLTGPDSNGSGGTATFTYGIEAVEVVDGYQGDYTVVSGTAQAVTNVSGSGASATLDIFYGVKTVTITEKGSGYTGAEAVTFSVTTDGAEVRATGTLALVADSGAVGSATNQENAIIAYAWVDGLEEVDIIRQVSTDRYRINSDATGNNDAGYVNGRLVANKVADDSFSSVVNDPSETEMNIWAFDSEGKSYLVKKLTARKAVVYPFACARLSKSAGTQFTAGSSVPWKFFEGTTADSGYVKIENA